MLQQNKILTRQIKRVCIFALVMLLLSVVFCGVSAAADENKISITFTDGKKTCTQTASADEWFILNPVSDMPFTAPREKPMFIGWSDGVNCYTDKQAVNISENLTLSAQWAAVTDWDGTSDITAAGYYKLSDNADVTKTIAVTAAPVVIDLNGRVLDGGWTTGVLCAEEGSVVTLTDTSQNAVHYFSHITSVGRNPVRSGLTGKDVWKLCADRGAKPAGATPENTISFEDILKYDDWNNDTIKYITVTGGCITGGIGTNDGREMRGGGVYLSSGSVFTMNGGYIVGNTAKYGGGVENDEMFTMNGGGIAGNYSVTTEGTGSGGGVYNHKGCTVLNGGCIVGNTAKYGGGGFRIYGGSLIMFCGRIDANAAGMTNDRSSAGGGVNVQSNNEYLSEFIMYDGSVSGNKTAGSGGGIQLGEGLLTIYDGTIAWNSAVLGGGVNNACNGLTINGGDIIHNFAEADGGGVRNCSNAGNQMTDTHICGGNISYNHSGSWGGGIANSNAKLVIESDVTITYNTASASGGGIDNSDGGKLWIKSGTIEYNKAETGSGGGVNNYSDNVVMYNEDCETWISGGSIQYNSAAYGGGVYLTYFDAGESREGWKNCYLYISGGPVIKNNTSAVLGGADNVYLETWDEAGPGELENQRYIILDGKMDANADIHVSYPLTAGTEKWVLGVVEDGYAATEEDLTHFHADSGHLSAAVTDHWGKKTLIWMGNPNPADSDGAADFGENGLNPVPTPQAESPVPFAGLLAGLGAAFAAAFVCRRK